MEEEEKRRGESKRRIGDKIKMENWRQIKMENIATGSMRRIFYLNG
jgi:hypothetical protein